MQKHIKYESVSLSIVAKSAATVVPKVLSKGRCIGVAFFPFENNIPSQNINLAIEDTQGNPILEGVDVRDYLKGIVGGMDSYKQVNFATSGTVNIKLYSPSVVATDFKGQFLFVIQTDIS